MGAQFSAGQIDASKTVLINSLIACVFLRNIFKGVSFSPRQFPPFERQQ
jgi:hypothetical protein